MSILEELEEYDGERGRVVSFTLSTDHSSIEIEECCDKYFSAKLNRTEFGQMIAELKALHAQMRDEPFAAKENK